MKKWLKIWVVALAMLATATTLLSTWKVEAENSNNKVEVIIWQYNSGQNTCTWSDYHYFFTASTQEQHQTITWSVSCKFWKMAQQAVTVTLNGALVLSGDTSVDIPTSNVLLTNGNWTVNPNSVRGTEPAALSDATFSSAATLFNKAWNTIGDANTEELAIKVIVPAWQPDGTYNGTLTLSYGG